MSAITVEEFVNKVSYKVDVESLKQVLRVTDKLYTHLGKALTSVSSRMDASWRTSMANMAKASHESARSIAEDGRKASAAWRARTPGTAAPGSEKGGAGAGIGLLALAKRFAAGYSAYSVGKFAVKSAADLERMTAQFEVMLGSADKAKAMIGDIQKLAASTPLETLGITQGVKTLLQFGIAGENAIDTVRMLGDVAGGDQERLNSLTYAYGQTVSAGKLMGQDLLQYINVGFNPLKIMGDNLDKFGLKAGTTQSDLRDMMSKGKISADMVTKAFQIATSQGGMFYQNMDKQSKTLGGLYSTMVDNIQMSLVKAIEPLLPLMKEFVDWLGQLDWTPVVNTILVLADVLTNYVVPVVKWLKDNWPLVATAMLMVFGPAMLARVGTFFSTMAAQAVAAFGATATAAATAATASGISFAAMGRAMLATLNPISAVVAALGVVYYAYQRINDAREQGAREETYHAAMVEEAAAAREHATLALEKAKYSRYAATGVWTGGPGEAIPTRAAAAETARRLGAMVTDAAGRRDAANAKLVDASGVMPAAAPTADPFSALLQQQLNASKKVTITQNNNIQMPVTVDDKGNTQLTPGAVDSLVDVKLRSVLNVKFLGVLAQGI